MLRTDLARSPRSPATSPAQYPKEEVRAHWALEAFPVPKSAHIHGYPRTSDWRALRNGCWQSRRGAKLGERIKLLHTREVAGSKPAAPTPPVTDLRRRVQSSTDERNGREAQESVLASCSERPAASRASAFVSKTRLETHFPRRHRTSCHVVSSHGMSLPAPWPRMCRAPTVKSPMSRTSTASML